MEGNLRHLHKHVPVISIWVDEAACKQHVLLVDTRRRGSSKNDTVTLD